MRVIVNLMVVVLVTSPLHATHLKSRCAKQGGHLSAQTRSYASNQQQAPVRQVKLFVQPAALTDADRLVLAVTAMQLVNAGR